MMNLIAIALVTTSLAVAGVFSPNPQNNNGGEQVIVKEGHRAVFVEYADTANDGNTKVLITPPKNNKGPVEEQLSRAAASVAGVAQDVKGKAKEALNVPNGPYGAGPRELICDAYGRCKHRIAGVWSKAKEKVVEAEEEVVDAVGGAVDKAKDLASKATHKAEEGTEAVREGAKEKVREAGEAAERVKEKAGEKVRQTGDMARDTADKVKGKAGEVTGKAGEMARDTAEKVKGKAGEVVDEATEKVKEKGRKGKKELSDIVKRGKEVFLDAIRYVFWPESLGSLMNMVHLLGFAMAYGISVWVTFVMSHVLAGVLPRQQFGMVQSKIYPVYFKAMVGSIGLALVGYLLGQRSKVFRSKAEMLQFYDLVSSLLSVLANLLFLEPKATKVMFERMKLEKEEGRGRDHTSPPTRVIDTVVTDTAGPVPTTSTTTSVEAATPSPPARANQDEVKTKMAKLDERLKKLNSYSSLLNIMTLMSLTWHLVYLSQRLGVNS